MYADIPDKIRGLIEPVVEDHGYELMNVETQHGRQSVLMRITIDSRAGDGRVKVDDVAAVSREIETNLDAADAVDGVYRLEVSSPGLDRVLAREKDFAAACGCQVNIKTRRPLDGRRRFKGGLVDFRDGRVVLEVEGDRGVEKTTMAFDDIEKANVVYAFSSEDFVSTTEDGTGAAAIKNRERPGRRGRKGRTGTVPPSRQRAGGNRQGRTDD